MWLVIFWLLSDTVLCLLGCAILIELKPYTFMLTWAVLYRALCLSFWARRECSFTHHVLFSAVIVEHLVYVFISQSLLCFMFTHFTFINRVLSCCHVLWGQTFAESSHRLCIFSDHRALFCLFQCAMCSPVYCLTLPIPHYLIIDPPPRSPLLFSFFTLLFILPVGSVMC